MEALDIYFGHARGEQIEHDDYMRRWSRTCLADHWVTVLRRAPLDQQEDIVLTTDPAAEGGILTVCSDQLIEQGFGCVAREADTSWMYHHYSEPGGSSWVEQTLGWDDRFTDEPWRSLERASRLVVSLKMTPENVAGERLVALAGVVTGKRLAYHNFTNGYEDGDPEALVQVPFSDAGQGLLF